MNTLFYPLRFIPLCHGFSAKHTTGSALEHLLKASITPRDVQIMNY